MYSFILDIPKSDTKNYSEINKICCELILSLKILPRFSRTSSLDSLYMNPFNVNELSYIFNNISVTKDIKKYFMLVIV